MKAQHILSVIILSCLTACAPEAPSEEYLAELNDWKKERLKKLLSEEGYVNLAGLFWLGEGVNTFGSEGSDVIFPARLVDKPLGQFRVEESGVFMDPSLPSEIQLSQQVVEQPVLAYADSMKAVPEFHYKSLRWKIIRRGDQYGIRLRDLEHPNLSNMKPIAYFAANPEMKVVADFEPYDPPKMVMTANVLGMNYKAKVPGVLRFTLQGTPYAMEPNIDGEYLHLRFTDETTGESTYGLGRYLHAPMPDANNKVTLDFNRAYNPPCAFTEFATCPIPPKENHIPFALTVGEKSYEDH